MVAANNIANPAISAATTNQKKYKLSSHNIANSEQSGYANISAQTAALPAMNGVRIQGFTRAEDRFLFKQLTDATSALAGIEEILATLDFLINKMGRPGQNDDFISSFSEVLLSFKSLERDPASSTTRLDLLQQLKDLFDNMHNLSDAAYSRMVELDNVMAYCVDECNLILRNIHALNVINQKLPKHSLEYVENLNKIDGHLLVLAEFIQFRVVYGPQGEVRLNLEKTGQPLLDTSLRQLRFQPEMNADKFIQDKQINAIYLDLISKSGLDSGARVPLVLANNFSAVAWNLGDGKLAAALKQRNQELLYFVRALDIFANVLYRSLNHKHSELVGIIPRSEAISTRLIARYDDLLSGQGELVIGLLGKDGLPYLGNDKRRIPCFKLDLANFTHYSASKSFYQNTFLLKELFDEVNQYFSLLATAKRLECNGLYDCKIGVIGVQDAYNIAGGGGATKNIRCDLDCRALCSESADDIYVELTSVKSKKQNDSDFINDLPVQNGQFILKNGEKLRINALTGLEFTAQSDAANPVVALLLELRVLQNGVARDCACVYKFEGPYATASLMANMRIPPSDLLNPDLKQEAILHAPPLNSQPLRLSLIDNQNRPLDAGKRNLGYARIAAQMMDLGFIIDSQKAHFAFGGTEKQLGAVGFNELLALNDMLVWSEAVEQQWDEMMHESAEMARANYPKFMIDNLPLNMRMRPDIAQDYRLLSIGKSARIGDYNEVQAGFYPSLGSGNIEGLADYLALASDRHNFMKTDILAALKTNLPDYLQKIIFALNNRFKEQEASLRNASARHEAIKDRFYSKVAVDLKQENNNIENYKQNSELNTNIARKANELINEFLRGIE